MSKRDVETKGAMRGVAIYGAAGAALGMVLTLLLLLGLSALIAAGRIPGDYGARCVMVCVLLGAAIGGLTAASRRGRGVLTVGALTGVGYIFLLIILALSVGTERIFGASFLKMSICALAGGAFGGALRSRTKSGGKTRRRKK